MIWTTFKIIVLHIDVFTVKDSMIITPSNIFIFCSFSINNRFCAINVTVNQQIDCLMHHTVIKFPLR